MGEIADQTIGDILEGEREDEDEDFGELDAYRKSCRYCGQHELRWGKHEKKWRLFARDGSVHACAAREGRP
jgi:hypothetical protein